MKRKLINRVGLLGIISLISYSLAVIISPMAYPGYNWMEQAVSDLSADSAPSMPYLAGTCSEVFISR